MRKSAAVLAALGFRIAFGGVEADHLKLYASFDAGTEPEIARGGFRLQKAGHASVSDGRFGQALHFGKKEKSEAPVYIAVDGFGAEGWTISFWLNMDERANAHYAERDYSRGVFAAGAGFLGTGEVKFSFNCWVQLVLDCRIAAGAAEACAKLPGQAVGVHSWTHVAVVFRPDGTSDVYLDGHLASYVEHKAALRFTPPRSLRVGGVAGNDQLDGSVDELKVFDKALTEDEVKDVMTSLPLRRTADIDLYLPFDGEISGRGYESFSSVGVVFDAGKDDDGVKIVRHGYDRRSILNVSGVKVGRTAQSTFAWFSPDWRADERPESRHGLWAIGGKGAFSHRLEKSREGLVYTVVSGESSARLVLDDVPWKNGKFCKVAAGYDFGRNEMFVSVDGMRITGPLGIPPRRSVFDAQVTVGDVPDADYYSLTQAEGTLDEMLVVNGYLDGDTLAEVAATEIAKKVHRVVPVVVNAPVSAQEAALWDLAPAERRRTPSRETIALNALWRCQLVDEARPLDANDWSYFPVPGRYAGHENGCADAEFYFRNRRLEMQADAKFAGKWTHQYSQAWFERAFKVEPKWKGKSLRLKFAELSSSGAGQVFLNGKLLGNITRGQLDVSFDLPEHLVRKDEWNFVTISVADTGQRWNWRGLRGDVSLEALPPVHGEAPEVVASVSKGSLSTSVRVVNSSSRGQSVFLEAEVVGAEKPLIVRSERTFADPGVPVTLSASSAFSTARLWDIDSPVLLKCVFRVKGEDGKVLDELAPVDFGVREFAIHGRDFFLNGKKVHLFISDEWVNGSDLETARKTARALKSLGYNTVRMSFSTDNANIDNLLRIADEEGILFLPNAIGVTGGTYARWNDPKVRDALAEVMRSRIERWRNHASAVMWYLSVNFLGYSWDYHPLKIADGYLPSQLKSKAETCRQGVDILRRFDGSGRPCFFQAGGRFGEVHTSNAYFCWWPQTEREAWPEEWSRRGDKPLVPIETSFPYFASFYGMDILNRTQHPLFYFENLARYYGPGAYGIEDPEMTRQISLSNEGKEGFLWYDANGLQRLKSELIVDTIRAWRGFDLSGTCLFSEVNFAYGRHCRRHAYHESVITRQPERDFRRFGWTPDFRRTTYQLDANFDLPLPVRDALVRALSPECAFFDGGESEPVDRQRNYASGERLEKRLVLVNDRRHAVTFRGKWRFGNAAREFERRVEPGCKTAVPIGIDVPSVGKKTRLALAADVSGDGRIDVDPLEIVVWPKQNVDGIGEFGLYDTTGLTSACLDRLGVNYRRILSAEDVNDGLTVVGAEALDDGFFQLARGSALAGRVGDGRANVLVLAQRPEVLAKLGLRTTPVYARTAFDARGRRVGFWAGAGLLAPEKPQPDPKTETDMPEQFSHWNNANIICSYPILRPSEGRCEVVFSCGMDLVYAPVIEVASGRGAVTFCQFEVERRSRGDPEADALLVLMLRRCAKMRADEEMDQAVIAGSDRAAEFGVVAIATNVSRIAVAKAGRSAFPAFSARDGYLRRQVATTVFSGDGVVPLLEPAVAAMKTVKGKRVIFYEPPQAPCAKERALAAKATYGAAGSSFGWAAEVVENRFRCIGSDLQAFAGMPAANTIAERFEKPLGKTEPTTWPYRFNTSTYHTEKHIRW